MDFVKLMYNGNSYTYKAASSLGMCILGRFLSNDVGYCGSSFKEWALDDSDLSTSSNITALEKEDGNILLSDLYSDEEKPTELRIPLSEFIKLIDYWEHTVCKMWPKEVIIKRSGHNLTIETQD